MQPARERKGAERGCSNTRTQRVTESGCLRGKHRTLPTTSSGRLLGSHARWICSTRARWDSYLLRCGSNAPLVAPVRQCEQQVAFKGALVHATCHGSVLAVGLRLGGFPEKQAFAECDASFRVLVVGGLRWLPSCRRCSTSWPCRRPCQGAFAACPGGAFFSYSVLCKFGRHVLFA